MWETDEPVPTRDFAISQDPTAFAGRKLLLDGQQRLTSLTAVLNGEPVSVRNRKRPIDILFNLDHPDGPPIDVVEVQSDEDTLVVSEDEVPDEDDEADDEQGIYEKLSQRTFVVASKSLLSQSNWVSVSAVFRTTNDAEILKKAGIKSFEDERFQKYSDRLKKLRAIKQYHYVVHVLERAMSYLDFLRIHPFRDGNGPVSRLLWLLQSYHAGYEVGRYISFERLIEQNKARYCETWKRVLKDGMKAGTTHGLTLTTCSRY